jgi:hypothetical protein
MRGHRGAHLPLDRGVGREQREVAVGRPAGEDLDRALLLEPAEAGHDVHALRPHEVLERVAVEALPALGECGEGGFAGAAEPRPVLGGGRDLLPEIVAELAMEIGMRQLLAQHRGEIDRDPERSATGALVEHAREREVGLRHRLVEPVHSMRPAAVMQHPRQMGVEHERERSRSHGLSYDLKPRPLLGCGSPGTLMTPNWAS